MEKSTHVEQYNFYGRIYEGEYLNGEKNGKGKEYYDNGQIKFEGEYLNGKKNGKGQYKTDSNALNELEEEEKETKLRSQKY